VDQISTPDSKRVLAKGSRPSLEYTETKAVRTGLRSDMGEFQKKRWIGTNLVGSEELRDSRYGACSKLKFSPLVHQGRTTQIMNNPVNARGD